MALLDIELAKVQNLRKIKSNELDAIKDVQQQKLELELVVRRYDEMIDKCLGDIRERDEYIAAEKQKVEDAIAKAKADEQKALDKAAKKQKQETAKA